MSTNISTDLRSRRTRKQLQQALGALINEKPFNKIQITEITDRAEVSRPAFYLHFRSKEDLLISHLDIVFDEFHERSLNADLGLALAWEVRGALRPDLLLLVMSATLDAAPVAVVESTMTLVPARRCPMHRSI